MLLAIDVGNTETKLGCFQRGSDRLIRTWRVTTEQRRTGDEYGVFLTQLFATEGLDCGQVGAIVIASVVPKLEQVLADACNRFFQRAPVFFRAHRQGLMPVLTERPGEVGADLVAAAIGARAMYGKPLIVISYGTATAFVAISPEGAYVGTAIAPGIAISIDALIGRTAKLPQISLRDPGDAIGRDTIASLQSGIVYGFVGQTEALVRRIRSELGQSARVVATGGLADVVAGHTNCIDVIDPHVSIQGLRLFVESSLSA
ncbi:MAG: type III pantothenate kinase [Candidatus Eremiobacteraeota bacterium]|nr:type III pantothenate kinase [Candidatus Eremiobacteraeota bacterium]